MPAAHGFSDFVPGLTQTIEDLETDVANRNETIQYQEDGVDVGVKGGIDTVNFTGTGITVTNPSAGLLVVDGPTAGVYTPTRSAETNLDSNVTPTEAQYMRVGSTVTVSGMFTADPTTPAVTTRFELSLPVASNFGAIEDCSGVAFCGGIAGMGASIQASTANDTAKIYWIASDVTSQQWTYSFTYQVI